VRSCCDTTRGNAACRLPSATDTDRLH
jgi:hypothetical protein